MNTLCHRTSYHKHRYQALNAHNIDITGQLLKQHLTSISISVSKAGDKISSAQQTDYQSTDGDLTYIKCNLVFGSVSINIFTDRTYRAILKQDRLN